MAGVEKLRGPDTVRAQLKIEDPNEVAEGRLAEAVRAMPAVGPASPRRKPPMLSTSTSGAHFTGDPIDEGLGHSLIGRVAHFATDARGQLIQCRCGTTKLARTDYHRHALARAAQRSHDDLPAFDL
jgi:hypothetical protein